MTMLHSKYRPLGIAAVALICLPLAMPLIGQTVNTATAVVILVIAAMGLNILVGYTGLISFGHAVWFGIGAYAAALSQRHWFPHQIAAPILVSLVLVAALSVATGFLVLRRRGVYFSLMTLALCALCYTVAFRWTEVTGGEDGLGGLTRGTLGPFDLDNANTYYIAVSLIGLTVLFVLLRVVRSPFGHVLVAIRENQLRAKFQGYPIEHYKLAAFVLSAVITGLAGALTGFQHYIVSAQSVSVVLSGELLAMVVIGGMHSFLGPTVGVAFYVLFRELFSVWTANWLLWFGIAFVAFVLFSPGGLVGIWDQLSRRWRKQRAEAAAMSSRRIAQGVPLPEFIRPAKGLETVLEAVGVSKHFGGIHAVSDVSFAVAAGQIHALIGPNGAGKTTLFNLVSGMMPPDRGAVRLHGREIQGQAAHRICQQGLARSFQITNLFGNLPVFENLRLSVQARHSSRFNAWRDIDSYPDMHAHTTDLVRFLGLEGIEEVPGGSLSYGGQRLVDLGIALASKPQILLLDEPFAGLAAAERERVANLVTTVADRIPVLIVEHDIDRILGFSHRVTVMNQGEVLMCDAPEAVRNDKRVQEVYTGSGTPAVVPRPFRPEQAAPPLLEFKNVNAFYGKSHILNNASLTVSDGEIVALLGRNGAGKSTLLKTLAGLVPAASGSMVFDGRELVGFPAPDIARLGIGYVPQGRGLFAGMTVAENLMLGRLARSAPDGNGKAWSQEQILDFFPPLRKRLHIAADYLSGGEQQMLAVARALSGHLRLLLLDEPFEGLAPAVIEELFTVFDKLRYYFPILIVEHNLDLVLALADRVVALERGAVFHECRAEPLLHDLEYRKRILWL